MSSKISRRETIEDEVANKLSYGKYIFNKRVAKADV
jgi:hypothetical protein